MRIFHKYALEFTNNSATDDMRIEFPSFDNSLLRGDKITVSFWIKPKYINYGENQYVVSLYNRFLVGYIREYDGAKVFRVIWSSKLNPPYTYDGGGDYIYNWIENEWQLWTVTFEDGKYIGYINGVKLFERYDDSKVFKYYSDRLIIGGLEMYGCMNGILGEVRIYNRALTEQEIQYLYNGGHIKDGLVFWLYPDMNTVTLDSDGQTVLSVTEKVNGYVGTAYNGVKLVDGKDIELGTKAIFIEPV